PVPSQSSVQKMSAGRPPAPVEEAPAPPVAPAPALTPPVPDAPAPDAPAPTLLLAASVLAVLEVDALAGSSASLPQAVRASASTALTAVAGLAMRVMASCRASVMPSEMRGADRARDRQRQSGDVGTTGSIVLALGSRRAREWLGQFTRWKPASGGVGATVA